MKSFKGSRLWHRDRPQDPRMAHLGLIEIQLADAKGEKSYQPNDIVIAMLEGLKDKLVPIDGVSSIINGEPAIYYRTREAELALTPDQAYRLVMLALTPKEFIAICDAVGATYELHDDFYTEDGVALQARIDVPDDRDRGPIVVFH